MSLAIKNSKAFNDIALITIKYVEGDKTIIQQGDFTIIKVNNEMSAINISDSSKYLSLTDGVQTLSSENIKQLEKHGIIFEYHQSFVIGEIIERVTHPKSDKLFVLKVKTNEELQIVTNSTNSTIGKQVIVANVGTILPTGVPILKSRIMGVDSDGMLVGTSTLGEPKSDGVKIVNGVNGDEYIL